MANTWNNTTYVNLAQVGFTSFLAKLLPLKGLFTTDFSDLVASQGTQWATRIVATRTAGDITDDHSGDYTAACGDTTTTAVTGTLSWHPIEGFYFTDLEADSIAAGVYSDTVMRLLKTSANAVAKYIHDKVIELITNASYSQKHTAVTAANFDVDDVADQLGTVRKLNWDMEDVRLVLQTDYITALRKDNAMQDNSASEMGVLKNGAIGRLFGIPLFEDVNLPVSGGTTETEYLTGFWCTPAAVAVAMRVPSTQAQQDMLAWVPMVDEETGISLVFSAWFDRTSRKKYFAYEALAGGVKAYTTALYRVVSA